MDNIKLCTLNNGGIQDVDNLPEVNRFTTLFEFAVIYDLLINSIKNVICSYGH